MSKYNYTGLFYYKLLHTQAKLIHVSNGIEDLTFVKVMPILTMVLMDFQLPGMNGFEATAIIKKHRKELPVIAETAYVHDRRYIAGKKSWL